jgi:nitrite reductase/ring-hydroxylating ferredoxin subunit
MADEHLDITGARPITAEPSRRRALEILGAGGVVTLGLACGAGCGGRPDGLEDDGSPSDPSPAAAGTDPGDPGAGGDDAGPPPSGDCGGGTDYGAVTDFPPGSMKIFGGSGTAIIVAHDDGGLFAMTGLCTHARCPVTAKGSGASQYWYCRCHGAKFGFDGTSQTRVAPRALPHYELSVCGGRVMVAKTAVDASTRVKV